MCTGNICDDLYRLQYDLLSITMNREGHNSSYINRSHDLFKSGLMRNWYPEHHMSNNSVCKVCMHWAL